MQLLHHDIGVCIYHDIAFPCWYYFFLLVTYHDIFQFLFNLASAFQIPYAFLFHTINLICQCHIYLGFICFKILIPGGFLHYLRQSLIWLFFAFFSCLHLVIICFYISVAGDKNLPNANSKWRSCINSIVVVIHSDWVIEPSRTFLRQISLLAQVRWVRLNWCWVSQFSACTLTASLPNEVGCSSGEPDCLSVCSAKADDCRCLCSVRFGGAQLALWAHGSCWPSRLTVPGRMVLVQAYCANPHARPQPGPPPPSNTPTPNGESAAGAVRKRVLAVLWVK